MKSDVWVVGQLLGDARGEARWRAAQPLHEGRSFELWLVDDQHVEGVRAVAKRIRYEKDAPAHVAARRALLDAERDLYLLPSSLLPEPLDWLTDSSGEPWLVYELQSGESLAAVVAQSGPLGPARAVRLVRELSLFAAEVHAAGFVLRDLSPAHVILGLDDTLAVVGLGNATRAGMPSPEDAHKRSFTPAFSAPESLERGIVAPSADVYTLGSLLAFLAGGSPEQLPEGALADVVRAARATSPSARPNAKALHASLAAIAKGMASARVSAPSQTQPAVAAARTSSAAPARPTGPQPSAQSNKTPSATPARPGPAQQSQTSVKATSAAPTRADGPAQRDVNAASSAQPQRAEERAQPGEKKAAQKRTTWPWWLLAAALVAGAAYAALHLSGKL